MYDVSWTRYEGRALADATLAGEALNAALEDHIRVHNPHLTDVRADQVTPTEEYDTTTAPPRRWYSVTYLAEDGEGH